MKELFIEKSFRGDGLAIINEANMILDDHSRQGIKITLRQLYYRLVAKLVFANTDGNFRRLGRLMSEGRLAGLVDWEAIQDPAHRGLALPTHRPPHPDARLHVEVWATNPALAPFVGAVCWGYGVNGVVCQGYPSQITSYEAGRRLRHVPPSRSLILHLADHDPKGLAATPAMARWLAVFTGAPVQVKRIGLTYNQVEAHDLVSNPSVRLDDTASEYIAQFGGRTWELEAFPPTELDDLLHDHLDNIIKQL